MTRQEAKALGYHPYTHWFDIDYVYEAMLKDMKPASPDPQYVLFFRDRFYSLWKDIWTKTGRNDDVIVVS